RDGHRTHELAEAAVVLSQEQGFAFRHAQVTNLQGWALVAQGQREAGLRQIQQGLAAARATGAEVSQPYCLALLAEAYGQVGQIEAGLQTLAEALTLADKNGERSWEAELQRLQGEFLLRRSTDQHAEAEACFQQAIAIAQQQQARSLQLRAAMSLSRLWQQQGKRTEARQLLAEVYGWFTEGFDTPDLQEARALLHELARS
ncbi:MAG: hypothetical protein L0177_17850, partial [Chloroflexi bacterium]|nr:hypothetical protein [Chloroflexota bacterium]